MPLRPVRPVRLALLLAVAACTPRVAPPEAPIVDPGVRTDTLVLAAPGTAVLAQEEGDTIPPQPDWARQPVPRFEDYPATESFAGTPAPVDLRSQPWARMYRSALRSDAAAGPNFAGAYTIARWGCGTQCLDWAVVDARTGRVHGNPFDSEGSLEFRRDSRLVVLNALQPGELPWPGRTRPAYFVWDGREMVRVQLPPPPPPPPPPSPAP
jgi:hypothetical protein